jgi:undecaprenyl-diphosphatase
VSLFQALILGIVQGATEFLPVSSSGHLALLPWWLGWNIPDDLVFAVAVHLGTLLAVVIYFRRDWIRVFQGGLQLLRTHRVVTPESSLFLMIVVGSIPVGLLGTTLSHVLENVFQAPAVVSVFLLITAGLLTFSEKTTDTLHLAPHPVETMTWRDALFIGLAQLAALLPGISRSGSTIAAGLFRGIDRADSARFSFMLGTPAIIGAGLLTSLNAWREHNVTLEVLPVIVGFASAAVVGYIAIAFLLAFVRQRRLYGFAVYCTVVSLVTLAAVLLGR